MRTLLRNLPIGNKLTLLVVVTTSLALLSTGTVLFGVVSMSLRRSITGDLATVAQILAANSTAAVAFDDASAASELLTALRAKPQVVGAEIRGRNQVILARYGAGIPDGQGADPLDDTQVVLTEGTLWLTEPVLLSGDRIGTLRLRADFATTYRILVAFYAKVLAMVLLAAIVAVVLVSRLFQRAITRPILRLADVARTVAVQNDYSVRAEKESEDEIGRLTDTFNAMLTHIERQDATIKASQARFEAAVEGSSDGIWELDLEQGRLYCSPRWQHIIGFEEGELPDVAQAWQDRLHPDDVDTVGQAVGTALDGTAPSFAVEYRLAHKDGSYRWVQTRGAALATDGGPVLRLAGSQTDITARKSAEVELAGLNARLLDVSRQAGMAEVATGVLHNVGNVLNSVIVSSGMAAERMQRSKIEAFAKVAEMLAAHQKDLVPFLTEDPKGKRLPEYIIGVAAHLQMERADVLHELDALRQNVEHIKEIVAVQQNYAGVAGCVETLSAAELVEDALRLNTARFARHGIELVRRVEAAPPVRVDRHKVLQIVVNLLGNAKHAVEATERPDKRITVSVESVTPGVVTVSVADNGVGISAEHLVRIFNHGFTTKAGGHGFGLHSGANAAREMGGDLSVTSDGPGHGATFTLTIPAAPLEHHPSPATT